jgi:hypothetical protein
MFRAEIYSSGKSSALKMEAKRSSEASENIYHNTLCQNCIATTLRTEPHISKYLLQFNEPYICYACKLSAALCYNRLIQALHELTQKVCLSSVDFSQY